MTKLWTLTTTLKFPLQADEGKDYPFARFNKTIEVPTYTEVEYQHHLVTAGWSREETDHLMDLAQRFDLRFIVMADRWDRNSFTERSVEDLKERYYSILEKLERVHGGATGEQVNIFFSLFLTTFSGPYYISVKSGQKY